MLHYHCGVLPHVSKSEAQQQAALVASKLCDSVKLCGEQRRRTLFARLASHFCVALVRHRTQGKFTRREPHHSPSGAGKQQSTSPHPSALSKTSKEPSTWPVHRSKGSPTRHTCRRSSRAPMANQSHFNARIILQKA